MFSFPKFNLKLIFKRHHKISSKATKFDEQLAINLDQYLSIYELANDKTFVLPKDVALKFQSSFQIIRNIFLQNLNANGNQYFEILLINLPLEDSPKQSEVKFRKDSNFLKSIFKNDENFQSFWSFC